MKPLPGHAPSAVFRLSAILTLVATTMATAQDTAVGQHPQAGVPLTMSPQGQAAHTAAQEDTLAPLGHGSAYALEDLHQVFGNVSFRSGPRTNAVARPASGQVASEEVITTMLRARFGTQASHMPDPVDRTRQFHDALLQFAQPGKAGRLLTYGDLVTRR